MYGLASGIDKRHRTFTSLSSTDIVIYAEKARIQPWAHLRCFQAYATLAACLGDEWQMRFGGEARMKLFPLKDTPLLSAGFFINHNNGVFMKYTA